VPKRRSEETIAKLSAAVTDAWKRGDYSQEIKDKQNELSHSEEAKQKRLATRAKNRLLTPQERLEKGIRWQEKQLLKLKRQAEREAAGL
jgi:hypothetical protein